MLNIIRADLYRILRGKGIYITLLILLALTFIIVLSAQPVSFGIDMSNIDASMEEMRYSLVYDGVNIAQVLCTAMELLMYFLLPLIIISTGAMFSSGSIKNELSGGMSRLKLYFSKLLLNTLLYISMMFIYMIFGIISAAIMRGFGEALSPEYWSNILKMFSSQLYVLFALNCFGTFLMFATKRTAIVNGVYIAFCIAPPILIYMLDKLNENFSKLYDYCLTIGLQKLGYMELMSSSEIAQVFITGAFYILASTIGGLALFKKCEIK